MRNYVIKLIAILAIAGCGVQNASATLYGSGTSGNPYMIRKNADWDEMVTMSNSDSGTSGVYFEIDNDLSGLTSGLENFRGHLNANGKSITFNGATNGFIYNGDNCTISNLVVKGTVGSTYIFHTAKGVELNNCIIDLKNVNNNDIKVFVETGTITFAKTAIFYNGIVDYKADAGGTGYTNVKKVTLDPGVKADMGTETGTIANVCHVYNTGLEYGANYYIHKESAVTVSVPGIKIISFECTGAEANKSTGSTIEFVMPDNAVSLHITKKSVTYLSNAGTEVTTEDFSLLTGGAGGAMSGGVYAVSGDVGINGHLAFSGNTTIVLTKGSSLSFSHTFIARYVAAIDVDGNLNITGSEEGKGTFYLNIEGSESNMPLVTEKHIGVRASGNINISGGYINVSQVAKANTITDDGLALYGFYAKGDMNIRNTKIEMNSTINVGDHEYIGYGSNEISNTGMFAEGNINVISGQIEMTGSYNIGMSATSEDKKVNIDWVKGTDSYNVTNYDGCVAISSYKCMHNGSGIVSGTDVDYSLIDGKTLVPALDLWNGGKNSDRIAQYGGQSIGFFLDGRTLYKDGAWNTLCLPVNLSKDDVASFFGEGAIIKELDTEGTYDGHKTGLDGGVLYLNFTEAKAITAGRPYIIKWTGGDNLTEPLFEGVTISKAGPQPVTFSGGSFVGNYDEVKVAQGDAFRYIILAGGNKLGYSAVGSTLHNFRAHFEILDATAVKGYQLSFGEAGTTGIIPIKAESDAQGIYSLDGLRLESIPTRKGIYIKDGKKVIVND
jgi:hypothetical protein